jgi:hypothetical protein
MKWSSKSRFSKFLLCGFNQIYQLTQTDLCVFLCLMIWCSMLYWSPTWHLLIFLCVSFSSAEWAFLRGDASWCIGFLCLILSSYHHETETMVVIVICVILLCAELLRYWFFCFLFSSNVALIHLSRFIISYVNDIELILGVMWGANAWRDWSHSMWICFLFKDCTMISWWKLTRWYTNSSDTLNCVGIAWVLVLIWHPNKN